MGQPPGPLVCTTNLAQVSFAITCRGMLTCVRVHGDDWNALNRRIGRHFGRAAYQFCGKMTAI